MTEKACTCSLFANNTSPVPSSYLMRPDGLCRLKSKSTGARLRVNYWLSEQHAAAAELGRITCGTHADVRHSSSDCHCHWALAATRQACVLFLYTAGRLYNISQKSRFTGRVGARLLVSMDQLLRDVLHHAEKGRETERCRLH